MATDSAVRVAQESSELTDEQITQLLAQATQRLEQKEKAQQLSFSQSKNTFSFPKLDAGEVEAPFITIRGKVATVDGSRLVDEEQRKPANKARKVEDPLMSKKLALMKNEATAGSDWFDLPRTDLTPELKRDLQLIKMRNVLDPHRHYKKDGGKMEAPAYSQVGTIVEGATEFFTGRIENKKRKRTLVEEVLAGEQETGRFKKKYGDLQHKKTSGKKGFYKALQAKRKGTGKG